MSGCTAMNTTLLTISCLLSRLQQVQPLVFTGCSRSAPYVLSKAMAPCTFGEHKRRMLSSTTWES